MFADGGSFFHFKKLQELIEHEMSMPSKFDINLNHPSRNNPNSPLFIGLSKNSMGRRLNTKGLYQVYKGYKEEFFPKLLAEGSTIPNEEKEKIKNLLSKPFNPYIRRHSALTEKSTNLKSSTLNEHAGWSPLHRARLFRA